MTILDYPQKQCFTCKGDTWWYSGSNWLCAACHIPPTPQDVLKMRIVKGTWLLNQKKHEISMETFLNTIQRLKELWGQVETKDCLYIENGKKLKKCVPEFHHERGIECFACGNQYWLMAELNDKPENVLAKKEGK